MRSRSWPASRWMLTVPQLISPAVVLATERSICWLGGGQSCGILPIRFLCLLCRVKWMGFGSWTKGDWAQGPEISAIGIGAMSFSNFYGATDETQSHAILSAALDEGVTHIDTANVYGMGTSETVIGTFLANQGKRRNELFSIASKAGIARRKELGERYFDNSPAYLEAELDKTLARLGVDIIDLYYIHRRDSATPIEEVSETLAGFIRAGKIKSFGFSEIAPTSLATASAVHPVAAVQSEYSLSVRVRKWALFRRHGNLERRLSLFHLLADRY